MRKGTEIPELKRLIATLERTSRKNSAPIWARVAKLLSRPTRRRVEVNINTLAKHAPPAKVAAVVPGKILSLGTIGKPFTVAAFRVSKPARGKLEKAKCKIMTIEALVEQNPKGSGIVILT
ncbi:MAG: 50S ribosomal protein L18e [Candidatus Micrarchaeota archaeon]